MTLCLFVLLLFSHAHNHTQKKKIIWKDANIFFSRPGIGSYGCIQMLAQRTATIHQHWSAQKGCLVTGWWLVGGMFTLTSFSVLCRHLCFSGICGTGSPFYLARLLVSFKRKLKINKGNWNMNPWSKTGLGRTHYHAHCIPRWMKPYVACSIVHIWFHEAIWDIRNLT
jgi:hypothetical protein